MSEHVTIGEVYRICQRIEEQVMLQNGRVRKLENDNVRIKTLWTVGTVVAVVSYEWVKHKLGF